MSHRDQILRAVLIALLLYSMSCLVREYRLLGRTEALTQELAARQETLLTQKRELAERLERPLTEAELRRLAWERLGMVAPGEKVFYFTDREDTVWDWRLEALWKDG